MTNIIKVNYETIPSLARQIRTYAQELNIEIINVYNDIADMHNYWHGQRYNVLSNEFNNIIPSINELLNLVVGELPYLLEIIANNYSYADKSTNVANAVKLQPKKVMALAVPKDIKMKFVTENVKTIKEKVSINFKNAKDKMNSIEATCNQIEWNSEAAEAFRMKFTKLKTNIVREFENIDTQFSNLMIQTMEDIQVLESSNIV